MAIVNFIPSRRLIEEVDTGGDNELDIDAIYSEWKVWYAVDDNSKNSPAMRTVGGDSITEVQDLGATFFLINGWRFKPAERNHRLTLVGNWFTDPSGDFTTVATDGNFQVLISERVSNLTDASVAKLDLAQLQKFIYLDDVLGNDINPGTPTSPIRTIAQGFVVAAENNLNAFSIKGDYTLDRDAEGWNFAGTTQENTAIVNLNGFSVNFSAFIKITMRGLGSGVVNATNCRIDALEGVSGEFTQCGLLSFIKPGNGTNSLFQFCFSEVAGSGTPTIDLGLLVDADLQMRSYVGGLLVQHIDVVGQSASFDMMPGHLKLDNTNTAGDVVVRGLGKFTNNSAGVSADDDGFIDGRDVTNARKIYSNRQLIEVSTNTLKIFDDDGTTVLFEYNLFDANGNATAASIFERVPK